MYVCVLRRIIVACNVESCWRQWGHARAHVFWPRERIPGLGVWGWYTYYYGIYGRVVCGRVCGGVLSPLHPSEKFVLRRRLRPYPTFFYDLSLLVLTSFISFVVGVL